MNRRIGLGAMLSAGFLLAACASTTSAPPVVPIAWTQFGLGDSPELIARVLIGPGDECPTISVDGAATTMVARVSPRAAVFGRMCENRMSLETSRKVRISTRGAVLLEQEISRKPERIAVLGDTGCRLTHYFDQGCSSRKTWPFEPIANAAADKKPELVLHLGDYYYREAPCKRSATDCVPGPYGDREESWRAEFLEPGRRLLATAPWVFVRGNHEDCERGGYGWTYYFGDSAQACEIVHATTHIRLAGLDLINVDSAHTDDKHATQEVNDKWAALARKLRETPPSQPVMLVTHEPAYAVCAKPCDAGDTANVGGLRAIGDALRASGLRTILVSGHIHTFQAFDTVPVTLGGNRGVTQVIVGNGGADLARFAPQPDPSRQVTAMFEDLRLETVGARKWQSVRKGQSVARAQTWNEHGFGILTPSAGLELVMYDVEGKRKVGCQLAAELPPATGRCR